MNEVWPVIVLGGRGYVAGELLRLVAGHPCLELAAAVSDSHAGAPLVQSFGHLAPCYPNTRFSAQEDLAELMAIVPRLAAFSAAPHGVSAALLDQLLQTAERSGTELYLVDVSADYRFSDADAYAAVYGHPHGAPGRLGEFGRGLPEHVLGATPRSISHPGCFATAMLLPAVPLLSLNLVQPELYACGITGSTGSGRQPIDTTHHPQRHANTYAYKPLTHRHAPEVQALIREAAGAETRLHFVPHSGPFARGIELTLQARLAAGIDPGEVLPALQEFYADAPFVHVGSEMPRLKDVVGSNHARLGVAVHDDQLAVSCVIDNLVKGAAGGAVQWMNRLLDLPETTGLTAPAIGWT